MNTERSRLTGLSYVRGAHDVQKNMKSTFWDFLTIPEGISSVLSDQRVSAGGSEWLCTCLLFSWRFSFPAQSLHLLFQSVAPRLCWSCLPSLERVGPPRAQENEDSLSTKVFSHNTSNTLPIYHYLNLNPWYRTLHAAT